MLGEVVLSERPELVGADLHDPVELILLGGAAVLPRDHHEQHDHHSKRRDHHSSARSDPYPHRLGHAAQRTGGLGMSTGGHGHDHDFQDSGWCSRCMLRDDGRLLGKGGEVLRAGRGYTPDEIEHYRQKAGQR